MSPIAVWRRWLLNQSTHSAVPRIPFEKLGRTAVRLALERNARITRDDHVVLSTQLVVRSSVKPRPEHT